MKRDTFLPIAALGAVALVACGGQESAVTDSQVSAEDITGIAGTYRRTDPAAGELVLSPQGESWRVSVVAGGIPNGPSTAADCRIDAMGPLVDRRITATVAPAATEDGGIPGDAFQNAIGALVLVVGDGEVRIIEETASAEVCGDGSDLSGTYVRN